MRKTVKVKRYLAIFSILIFLAAVFLIVRALSRYPSPSDSPSPAAVITVNNTYYVSNSGSDSNQGTKESPFRTIQKAADIVKPGDTVSVRGGTYNEKVTIKNSGTQKSYIIFQNYPEETPVIDGKGLVPDSDTGLIYISDKSYIKISGFNISDYVSSTAAVPVGIRVNGASKNVEIRNCKISRIRTTYNGSEDRNAHGIAIYGTDGANPLEGVIVDNCEVFDCVLGQSETVVLNGNVTNFQITNNKIHDNDNIGIDFIGYEGRASANDYARNGICAGNQVWNISSGANKTYNPEDLSADGIYVDGGDSITIEKNKVWNCDIGIEAASEHNNRFTNNIIIRNNLIYNCRGYCGISIGGSGSANGGAANIKIYNNTLYNNDINMNFQNNCQVASNVVKNNIFYSGTIYEGNSKDIVFSNNITSDPGFVDSESDFHLLQGSPAINAGVNEATAGETDMDNNPRAAGGAVDCGCYESSY